MTIVERTAEFIRRELTGAEPGHDWWHTLRVLQRARDIQTVEGGDLELIELAALLHDLRDYKFEGGDTSVGPEAARQWLRSRDYPEPRTQEVARIVDAVHYKGPMEEERAISLEHAVVQDADRLDALGAIGVARAFSYGGHFGRAMFDPERLPDSTMDTDAYRKSDGPTVNHFFEKLLLLRERMLTPTGTTMARDAHEFMRGYLTRFLAESTAGELSAEWIRLLEEHR